MNSWGIREMQLDHTQIIFCILARLCQKTIKQEVFYFVSKTLKMSPTDQLILQQFYLILRNSLLNSLLNKGEKRLQIHNEIALSHTGYIFYVANLLFIQIYCANSL